MNESNLIALINAYADDYSIAETLDEFFPGMSIGEILNDVWNGGLIPTDRMEAFLLDDEDDS